MSKSSRTEKTTDFADRVVGTHHYKTTLSDGSKKAVGRALTSEKSQKVASDKWDSGDTSSTSCCYLMSACAKALDLRNDSLEQRALFVMQQDYLMKSFSGKKALVQYYELSPRIVSAINEKVEKRAIWHGVLREISEVTTKILEGKLEAGFEQYKNLTLRLKEKYL